MTQTDKARNILAQIDPVAPKMGAIKSLATAIKKDHALATELWAGGGFGPRLLALLIMDKMQLDQPTIEALADDMARHSNDERDKLSEWLLAHQLTKAKKTAALIETWQDHPSPVLRRLYWYHQARLRWTGKIPPDNTAALMAKLTSDLGSEDPQVQWAMNFTAGQIGIYDDAFRDACIKLGERTGLYKGDPVARGCTPNYLPEFIAIERAKLQ